MAYVNPGVWPPPATGKPELPDSSRRIPFSDFIAGGRLDVDAEVQPIYDAINKQYGLNEKP
jgi:hypothetical protein